MEGVMIVERTAGVANPAVTGRRVEALREKIVVAPAVAGRERLRELVDRSTLAQLIAAMVLISCAALIYLNQASKVSILQFTISDLQRQQIELRMQNANLYAQASGLQNLQRIEAQATTQLHMSKPDYAGTIWIQPVVPQVPPPPANAASARAQTASQPLAWMTHTVQFLAAQL
jgi:cell division protein FtsL